MERDLVVVGCGLPGLRAAAVGAARGWRVHLVQDPAGLPTAPAAALPWGRGCFPCPAVADPLAQEVMGPLQDWAPPAIGALLEQEVITLPASSPSWLGLRAPVLGSRLVAGLALARLRSRLADTIGAWSEVRTYADQVRQWYGQAAHELIYSSYCERRWGPPEVVAAGLARLAHGDNGDDRWVAPALGPVGSAERSMALVARSGELTVATVEGLRVEEGRVVAVETTAGSVAVTDLLQVDAPPRALARWLAPHLSAELASDMAGLHVRHEVQVLVPADAGRLPWELHLLDPTWPFHRISRPSLLPGASHLDGKVLLQASVDSEHPLWLMPDDEVRRAALSVVESIPGLTAEGEGGQVYRLPAREPVWTWSYHPVWLRGLAGLQRLGIMGVGPVGAFGPMEPPTEILVAAQHLAGLAPREIHRLYVDPPPATTSRGPLGMLVGSR